MAGARASSHCAHWHSCQAAWTCTGEALDDAHDPDATSRAEVAEAPAKCMEVTLREAPSVMGWVLGSIHALQRHRAGPLRDVTLTRQR